ncbi:MAG TPA: aldehyde dehydrogenase (NADP(+)) [Acidothermaceae bacterium]|jgi:NADP-dependent aldehyde dehydrogenase
MIDGSMLIGTRTVRGSGPAFQAVDPATGESLAPEYREASLEEVELACRLAAKAFPVFRRTTLGDRAAFLERIGDAIDREGDTLVDRVVAETRIPRARAVGELARTTGQLRFFARIVRQGDWLEATIDQAAPERVPLPRPDIRQRHIPVGPVAVFGAGNFPLAFSVAGGDTASALAAGCPVVVKAHSAHPGTAEIVGRAILAAAAEAGMPEGVFSMLLGSGSTIGTALVSDPRVASVGFTGSRTGGLALQRVAAARPVPIPVFAEMSSVNPVFLLPAALASRPAELARGFVASLGLSAGQLCTNPGLLIVVNDPAVAELMRAIEVGLRSSEGRPMLTAGIAAAYREGVQTHRARPGVGLVAEGPVEAGVRNAESPVVLRTDAATFLKDPVLSSEIFGAASTLVVCRDVDELRAVAEALEGQLTASIHFDPDDLRLVQALVPVLEQRCGRIVFDGWPTGVEVVDAMVHGGPFPATTDGRSTSVGALAIRRFLRPIAYQNAPAALLPRELADANELGLRRRVDGVLR